MKTLNPSLLFGSLILSLINVNAQTQQGSFRIGGGASYSHAAFNQNNAYSTFSFSPAVAYFPVKNLSVGLAIPYSKSAGKMGSGEYSYSRYSFGPEVRYYFPFGKWAAFPELSYSLGKSVSENSGFVSGDPIIYESETEFSAFKAGAGLTFFINNNVGAEAILFYQDNEQEVINPFSIVAYDKSITFSLGFQIYLNRK